MLKQILRDMYVDPEILAGLDETYKQTLFCKMREEQIRKWKIWDDSQSNLKSKQIPIKKKSQNHEQNKNVQFRLGEDGEPWVWVMGEHSNDPTIENIIVEEIQQKARKIAENEFLTNGNFIIHYNESNNNIEVENDEINEKKNNQSSQNIEDKEIKSVNLETESLSLTKTKNSLLIDYNINRNITNRLKNIDDLNENPKIKREILHDIIWNKSEVSKVSVQIAQWEKRSIGERTSEIFQAIQMKKHENAEKHEQTAEENNAFWEEQERKAKESEIKIREIARRARNEHRKSLSDQTFKLEHNLIRPPSQEAVVEWYINYEKPRKVGLNHDDEPNVWFYGLLERTKAEVLLMKEDQGTYLVRLSDKIWGYAISYRDLDKCKHYLVNVRNGKYKFHGKNQVQHDNLDELLRYHADVPITAIGMELLVKPCSKSIKDYQLGGLL